MRKNRLYVIQLVLVLAFLLPGPALADWGFRYGDDGWWPGPSGSVHYDYDQIEFRIITPGYVWAGNGVSNFSSSDAAMAATWAVSPVSGTVVTAAGSPATQTLFWDVRFSGTAPAFFEFDYFVFTGLTPVSGYHMYVRNGYWDPNRLNPFTGQGGWDVIGDFGANVTPVPIPAAGVLFGAGLIFLASSGYSLRRRPLPGASGREDN